MRVFSISLFFVLFFNFIVCATIWRVNKDPAADADFTEIQDAHNAASNGDTILVEGSSSNYAEVTSYKQLFLYGPGFLLDENLETQANFLSASINSITFDPGSDGSILSGFIISGGAEININTSDITIRRNWIWELNAGGNNSNVIIEQNFSNNTNPTYGEIINAINAIVRNNILHRTHVSDYAISCSSCYLYNNVIFGRVSVSNSVVNNNILIEGNFYNNIYQGKKNQINNNISNSDQFGTENGNQSNVLMVTVFVGATGNSTDGQWQLQPGSPAEGAGVWGVDCGIFGGNTPYVLSGMPELPAIFYMHTSGIGTTVEGLEVDLKAKTHD